MRKLWKGFLVGMVLACPQLAHALIAEWTETYDNPSYSAQDRGLGISIDSAGNAFVIGYESLEPGSTHYGDLWLRKYGSGGVSLWTTTYSNTLFQADEHGHGIAIDGLGDLYVVGKQDTDPTVTH